MNRKDFLRNAFIALAASLVPKVLQPLLPEINSEEMVDVPIRFTKYAIGVDPYYKVSGEYEKSDATIWKIRLPKSSADKLVAEYHVRHKTSTS